jgi:DNA modification methylase
MKIEYAHVQELRPYPNNARTHSRKQVRQIAKSIEKFGFCNPVLIDDAKQIIAGHGRVEAARLLGLAAVPTCRLSHLSEADKRAYVLADNRLAERAGWDKELLAIELQGLIDLNVEVELTGFDMGQIDLILEEAYEAKGAASGPEDQVPPRRAGPAITRTGDLWVLGAHRLLCADARDKLAYDQLLEGSKAELVVTDPPYNVPIDGNVCGLGRIRHRDFAMACGEMSEAEFTAFLQTVFERLAENSTDGSIHQLFMDWRHMGEMLGAGRQVYRELKNVCVWNKGNPGMGTFYRSQHELVFVWKSGTAAHVNNFELGQHGRNRTNVWSYPSLAGTNTGRLEQLAMHPTVKPVALLADAIRDCSRRNGLVLDPFCGSGSILIAAERTGRKARGLEIDPIYVDVAVRRWQAYTGKAAVLAGSGESFETTEEQRSATPAAAA